MTVSLGSQFQTLQNKRRYDIIWSFEIEIKYRLNYMGE